MKSSDFTLVLQQQLDVANETNRVLLARIDDLGKTIEELRTELAIANLKREELMSTITSMQEALLEKDVAVNNGVDLLPTICELAGIDCPKVDGVSLAKSIKGKAKPQRDHIYVESETFVSVIKDGFKYTYFDGDGGREILVNLKKDGGEMKNIASSNPAKTAELKAIAMGYDRKIITSKAAKSTKGKGNQQGKASSKNKKKNKVQ